MSLSENQDLAMANEACIRHVHDIAPCTQTFLDDVVTGFSKRPRSLPCKYFYDEQGSSLFEAICELDEYYLTRTELAIMRRFASEMAEQIGTGVMLVEYGSGASVKTRLLLDELTDPVAYVPVDISRAHLLSSASRLSRLYPELEILPVCADFTRDFDLPDANCIPTHNAVYFPGSTIGNFEPTSAKAVLTQIVNLCGSGGGLLLGVDLQKDTDILESAYNDSEGVTAAFNLNLLARINRELGGDICLDQFEHCARYDDEHNRIELSLVSRCEQTLSVGDNWFSFYEGEVINTEYSHKYTIEGLSELAAEVGLTLRAHWTDEQERFAVLHLAILK